MIKEIIKRIKVFSKKEKRITLLLVILFFSILIIPFIVSNYLIEIPKKGGFINEIQIGSNVRFINPVIAISQSEKDLLPIIYSSLLKKDKDGNIIDNIATVNVAEDNKTYNIELRKDVTFSNGQALTTDDIIFTIKKIQDPLLKSLLSSDFIDVEYEKIDNHNMNLILKLEYVSFLDTLTKLYIMPKKSWENITYDEFPFSNLNTQPIGSGPFKIKKIYRNDSTNKIERYELIKNDLYYNEDNIFIDGISFYFFDNLENYKNSLIYSNKKIIKNLPLLSMNELNELDNKKSYLNSDLKKITSSKVFGLFLKSDNVFLKDTNLRIAISELINRSSIIKNTLKDSSKELNSVFFNRTNESIEKNPDEIIEFLTKNKYVFKDGFLKNKEGEFVKLNIQIVESEEFKEVANNLKNQLLKIGIESEVISYTENNFLDSVVRDRNFDILFSSYQLNNYQDFFPLFHSSQDQDPSLNITGINSYKIDNLILELRKNLSDEDRDIKEEELDAEILKQKLFIPLYNPYYTYLIDSRVHNFEINTLNSIENRFNNLTNWYVKTEKILPFFR